jgi:hypothetical protein
LSIAIVCVEEDSFAADVSPLSSMAGRSYSTNINGGSSIPASANAVRTDFFPINLEVFSR